MVGNMGAGVYAGRLCAGRNVTACRRVSGSLARVVRGLSDNRIPLNPERLWWSLL